MTSLPRPTTGQPHYGAHLGDPAYWGRYVRAALDRHGLPQDAIEAPFVGTFPTFLVGKVVVKLFGDTFAGGTRYAAERVMAELLAGVEDVPAPGPVATGQLFAADLGWTWPYLIMERLPGRAIRELTPTRAAAEQLGRALATLHALPAPPVITAADPLTLLRQEAAVRQQRHGLPRQLAAQVSDFLADAPTERVLVHADLTADHLFCDDTGLVGIIDWADAIAADPFYELVALRFDAFQNRPDLFATTLESYGWPIEEDFGRRSLQAVLEFEYSAIEALAELVDLNRIRTLDELAERLIRLG